MVSGAKDDAKFPKAEQIWLEILGLSFSVFKNTGIIPVITWGFEITSA